MNQAGKHATADHGRVETKRERRRGAAGRAAVLRRAPSDSDCSGETASLSADSGDRAPRPVPLAPPRSGKTRSRRRGSEWEVLEGLKDGQRFEKRPDVFNGYLHKKRKWPLKGWHKRFFVVDGGILVYARSPTDVARGRLHGSVDVGLSVISAKARRRRIDIDADEFIYHLRAKTPELFRTWLNVLKVHRLYRQHLLTFGARESIPKIHAPLDDLPATDTSSHTSLSDTTDASIEPSNHDVLSLDHSVHGFESSVYNCKVDNSILNWQRTVESKNSLHSLNFKNLEQKFCEKLNAIHMPHNSICSLQCVTKRFVDEIKNQCPDFSLNSMIVEKQMTSTDLEKSCNDTLTLLDHSLIDLVKRPNASKTHESNDSPCSKRNAKISYKQSPKRKTAFINTNKKTLTTTCFFFARHKHQVSDYSEPLMKRSKKCTNLVKHRNITEESPLEIQSSKCTLLKKYKLSASKTDANEKARHRGVACDSILKTNNEVQVKMDIKEHKSSQISTTADYDKITEKLMISIFRQNSGDAENDTKYNIDQVVRELYEIKVDQQLHPVKALFRNLLEYWLKNTSVSEFKEAMTEEKSVDRQSNKHFSKDEKLSSSGCVGMRTKQTQFHGLSDMEAHHKANKSANTSKQKDMKCEKVNTVQACQSPKRDTESFEKERRIQELERLLKNTVYVCETTRNVYDTSRHNVRKKDIKITKTLMNNLGKRKHEVSPIENKVIAKPSSSTELPDIQDTINHLISETAIPPDVAKEFLGAYLDVLLQDSSKSKSTTTSQYSDWEKSSKSSKEMPACNVAAESVLKKVSKCVSTLNKRDNAVGPNRNSNTDKQMDAGPFNLKDVLDKVTTIFSKVSKLHSGSRDNKQKEEAQSTQKPTTSESVKPVFKFSKKDLVYENCDDNCLVIDLSKYKLEYISMFNDPASEGVMSVTVKLREKPVALDGTAKSNISMNTSTSDKQIVLDLNRSDNWLSFININDSISNDIFTKLPIDTNKITYLGFEENRHSIEVRPFSSSSNGTSKAYCPFKESNTSMDMTCTCNRNLKKEFMQRQKASSEMQSCYVMSIKKGSLAAAFQCKKKSGESNEVDSSEACYSNTNKIDEHSLFEKPAPRIIDEKFILLLLENLVLLSKNIPTLHKEINILYVKLKKKHEKVVKTCNHIQGLSLLGRIYSEDLSFKDGDDKGTQYELDDEDIEETTKEIRNACTNTDYNAKYIRTGSTIDCSVQTDENLLQNNLYIRNQAKEENHPRNYKVDIQTETTKIQLLERSTLNANNKTRRDTLNSIKKHILEDIWKVPATSAKPIINRDFKTMRTRPLIRENMVKEISSKPKILVSVHSQTEKQFVQMDWHEEMDLKVYQLLSVNKSRLKCSSSMTLAVSIEPEYNDELKTLYKCCSDPSFCSG